MIIVTGGAGFIGSNLIAALEAKGYHDITIVDRLGSDDKWKNISKREIRDIVDPEDFIPYLKKRSDFVDIVFHLGSISDNLATDADEIVENNYRLSRKLWRYCANYDARLIYASSATTYGDGTNGFSDEETNPNLSKLKPMTPNAWSKHLFDRRAARLTHDKSMKAVERRPKQWVGLKFFDVYGPNEYHKGTQQSLIAQIYNEIKSGETAKLFKSYHPNYEDGAQKRDFVYVKDCVNLMLWLMETPSVSGIYNVGTGNARSYKELALNIFKAAEKDPKIEYVPMDEQHKKTYQYYTQADISKLRKVGYDVPFTSIEDGVKDYIQNYLAHSDPYL